MEQNALDIEVAEDSIEHWYQKSTDLEVALHNAEDELKAAKQN